MRHGATRRRFDSPWLANTEAFRKRIGKTVSMCALPPGTIRISMLPENCSLKTAENVSQTAARCNARVFQLPGKPKKQTVRARPIDLQIPPRKSGLRFPKISQFLRTHAGFLLRVAGICGAQDVYDGTVPKKVAEQIAEKELSFNQKLGVAGFF